MISWMQKHKKYLVVTIWISTIAFVGAGFVGWGAYKFGSSGDTMAEVGQTKITIKEFQQRYTNLYNYYNQLFGNQLDQEKAKKMGLDKMAFNNLIQEALLANFAKDMGLEVSDEEVAQKIAQMKAFQEKGSFSKELYLQVLKQNRLKPKDFERAIKKELLIAKIKEALEPKIFDLEFNTTASALFIADKIEYKTLTIDDITLNYDPKELKNYYNEHKENYKTPTKYTIAIIEVTPQEVQVEPQELQEFYKKHRIQYKDKEGKILSFEAAKELVARDYRLKKAKKEALKRYIKLKKGQLKPQKEITIAQNDPNYPKLLDALASAPEGKVLKPILKDERYIVAKLQKKILPQTIPFEEAKEMVQKDFELEKKEELLLQKAQKLASSFQGEKTDFICRDDITALKLDPTEAAKFLKELFIQQKAQGFIPISQTKVVLYRVLDQKLGYKPKIDKNRAFISDNSIKLKENIQMQNLIALLQSLYEIKIYKGL